MHLNPRQKFLIIPLIFIFTLLIPLRTLAQVPDEPFQPINVGQLGFGAVLEIAISPTKDRFALATTNGIHIYAMENLDDFYVISPDQNILSIAWSPDGTQLAAGYQNGMMRIWDVESLELVNEVKAHVGPVEGMDWGIETWQIATWAKDGYVRVWKTKPLAMEFELNSWRGMWHDVFWLPGEQILFLDPVSSGSETFVDIKNQLLFRIREEEIFSAFDDKEIDIEITLDFFQLKFFDGKNMQGMVLITDLSTFEPDFIRDETSSADKLIREGEWYVYPSDNEYLKIVGSDKQLIKEIPFEGGQHGWPEWTPDDKYLIFISGGVLRVTDIETEITIGKKAGFYIGPTEIAWSMDGSRVGVYDWNNHWGSDRVDERILSWIVQEFDDGLKIFPDAETDTYAWEIFDNSPERPFPKEISDTREWLREKYGDYWFTYGDDFSLEIEWSPDGMLIAVRGAFGVILLDSETLEELFTIPVQFNDPEITGWGESGTFAWSPDSRFIAVDQYGGPVQIWQVQP